MHGMSDLERSTQSEQGEQSGQTTPLPRTAAATAGRMRASEERAAARLEARGWVCIPPDHPSIEVVRLVLNIDEISRETKRRA